MNPVHAIRHFGWHPCVAGQRPGGARARPARRSRPGIARAGPATPLSGPATGAGLEKIPTAAGPSLRPRCPGRRHPAWQIILIPASAALVAAALAVTAYRTQATRRRVTTTAA